MRTRLTVVRARYSDQPRAETLSFLSKKCRRCIGERVDDRLGARSCMFWDVALILIVIPTEFRHINMHSLFLFCF